MTKKRSSEIWKSRNFSGKGKNFKIFHRVRNFFENRGEIWNRGENASWSQGGWTPLNSRPSIYDLRRDFVDVSDAGCLGDGWPLGRLGTLQNQGRRHRGHCRGRSPPKFEVGGRPMLTYPNISEILITLASEGLSFHFIRQSTSFQRSND